jgi:mRNA-degrading endonuclease RelE of RelBE toxin-antitoxin system
MLLNQNKNGKKGKAADLVIGCTNQNQDNIILIRVLKTKETVTRKTTRSKRMAWLQ